MLRTLAIAAALAAGVACSRPETSSGPGPCGAPWLFEHEVVDPEPLARHRINDVLVADVDGDDRLDIVVTGRTADGSGGAQRQAAWYRNPAWTRHPIAPGDYKYATMLDVDADGDLDLVASRWWLENEGARSDWPRHELGIDFEPDLVLAGDLDGDARDELVLLTKREVFALARGDSPAQPWQRTLVARVDHPRTGGALGDLDGDGDLDVLWGNGWLENTGADWRDRTLDRKWPAEARGAIADLNGDGRADVVLTGEESEHGAAWFAAPEDPRDGRWTRHPIANGYAGVHSLQLADFDRDGDLDVFIAEMHHGEDPDRLAVFENVDAASDEWVEHVFATTGSHQAKVADLDGDGHPDVVGKNYQAGARPLEVEVWWNRVADSPLPVDEWRKHVIEAERPWRSLFVEAADLDGDGRVDVATGGWWYRNPGDASAAWSRNGFGGDFHQLAVLADFDGDGDVDALGTTGKIDSAQLRWAENDGRGGFTIHANVPEGDGDFLQGVRVGRLREDGPLEVVLSWHDAKSTQALTVPAAPADGEWSWSVLSEVSNGEQVALADLDGDADVDVHLGDAWLRQGTGSWTRMDGVEMGGDANPDRVELADVDGDGDLDAVIGAEHATRLVWGEAPDDPAGRWEEHVIADDILAMSVDVADLDGDGDPDVVAGEHDKEPGPKLGRVLVFRNEDGGERWSRCEVDRGMDHHDGTRLADIDGDGDLDIVSIGWYHAQVLLYENLAR